MSLFIGFSYGLVAPSLLCAPDIMHTFPLSVAGTPTAMQVTDEAADSTLQEFHNELCRSSFKPLRTAVALCGKGIVGEDLRQKCRFGELSDHEKRMAVIKAVRSNGEHGDFRTFVAILEWDPVNISIVLKIKGWFKKKIFGGGGWGRYCSTARA